jgi:ketosteroid isomerase-like protein
VSGAGTVRAFIDAFNGGDLDAFTSTLDPEIEIHAGRGLRKGVAAAREWATRAPRGIQQQILVEDVLEAGDRVVALIVREWWWGEEEEAGAEPAHADVMAWLFELRDGKIASWQAFDQREDALAALGGD